MKRSLLVILLVLMIIGVSFVFIACESGEGNKEESKIVQMAAEKYILTKTSTQIVGKEGLVTVGSDSSYADVTYIQFYSDGRVLWHIYGISSYSGFTIDNIWFDSNEYNKDTNELTLTRGNDKTSGITFDGINTITMNGGSTYKSNKANSGSNQGGSNGTGNQGSPDNNQDASNGTGNQGSPDNNQEENNNEEQVKERCTLTIEYNNGQQDAIITVVKGSTITINSPKKEGYTFTKWSTWYSGIEIQGDEITVSDDGNIWAEWELITKSINYNLKGGSMNNAKNSIQIQDLPYVLPDAVPLNLEEGFVKWTTDPDGNNVITRLTELKDYELYAWYENSENCLSYKYNSEINGYEVVGYTGKAKSLNIPSTYKEVPVKKIGDRAFEDCSSLTSVTIGNSVTSIGDGAFSGCSNLNKVNISSIESWLRISFYSYTSNPLYYAHNLYLNNELLTSITIPESVTSIGKYAFYGCSSLTSVSIGNSVTSIGEYAFARCSKLTNIIIPNGVTCIEYALFDYCYELKNVTIPNSVTKINSYAFSHCTSLTSIVIPDSVTSIEYGVFNYCSSLTNIVIPDSVTSIGERAFYGCSSLTSITIPDSVTSIGNDAFYRCASLNNIYIDAQKIANDYKDLLDYANDVYVLDSITITDSIYDVVFELQTGTVEVNGKTYKHFIRK